MNRRPTGATKDFMTRKIWQWAERGLLLAALLSLLSFGLLEFWFLRTAPSNPGLGAMHAIKWHGATVYLTDTQQLETDTLFWGGPVLLLVALGLNLWVKFRN
jgi:hypothetical protein